MSIADVTTGVFAALSVLAGLYEREQTSAGRRADIAMLDCQLALLENASARFLNAGEIATRVGSRHPKIAPFQAFAARDRSIVVAADGERNWQSMCNALGIGELVSDPRFKDNAARVEHAAELEELLKPVFAAREADELLELLAQHDVPCGPVNSIPEVLQMSHVSERNLISVVEREDGHRFRFIASPLSHGAGRKETAAPALGQHTAEIMRELGLKS
jgi:crotonobetainyl-CoA:carnitine CoA-transferase CaiB-like acyl-CoA transferase